MSFLIKRNNYWYIAYSEKKYIGGVLQIKRIVKTTKCKSKSAANIKLTEFNNKDKVRIKTIQCSEFLKKYLEFNFAKKRQHLINIKRRFDNLMIFLGDRNLELYTTEDFDIYFSGLAAKHSLYTVKGYRSDLHAGFQQALIWKYIPENPVFYSKRIEVPEPEIIFFTKEEYNIFLNSIENQMFKDICNFTLFTGLRAGDVCNVKLEDIFLDLKFIRITSTNSHRPKNQKTNWTEIADAIVPIIEKAFLTNKIYLFECPGTKDKLSTNYLCNRIKLYVRSEKRINQKHSHKSLRKTFASWLYQETQDFRKVYPHLHHSSPKVGLKHYAKLIHPVYTGITNLIDYSK